jgi:acyl transferase domain-containing protein
VTAQSEEGIAIVGMTGRFPGARNVEELWQLLASGKEARTLLSDEELKEAGVPDSMLRDPHYVKSCMKLDDPEFFDAEFFGYSPRQATSIDPQQRFFLECAWEALESAGYGQVADGLSVGVFAGSGFNGYLMNLLSHRPADPTDAPQYVIDGDKDYLTTRAAYKLGLTGPCVTVQTACSTSLVAVHLACRSLLDFECDMALAGGVTVRIPPETGYLYVPGGIASPDGHCRAFDAAANGCTGGSGVAIVALRRLSDALHSRDQIHAVIRSTAVNNDGSRKVGFSAPGLQSQAQLLATALALADLHPQDIGLIEAHGTGTPLGDSIELEALDQVYRTQGVARFCALGSIKTNIGHLDTAAGVTGLIKAVLCLKHRAFVPSLHFSQPNPLLEKPGSPFYVTTAFQPWETPRGERRCAGVSSFGIGGTNAHAILEEAPEIESASEAAVTHLFPLSARDAPALERASQNLGKFLETNKNVRLRDLAYTLQTGRRRFHCRRVVAASESAELISRLSTPSDDCVRSERSGRPIAFTFPGQGSQQNRMAAGLYLSDEFFKQTLDHCARLMDRALGIDVRGFLCGVSTDDSASLRDPLLVQPAIFVVEYCLSRLLMHWGVRPSALIGHSFGEYAAACVAGVLSVEDATALVAMRARLVRELPAGAMLAVCLPELTVREMLSEGLCIAAVNTSDQCVVSGEIEDVQRFADGLRSRGIEHHRLQNTRAFHSAMMRPAAPGLREAASKFARRAPEIPLISCVTGNWVTEEEIAEPSYWSDHLLLPVRFSAGLSQLAQRRGMIFVEVGPGTALTGIARQHLGREKDFSFIPSLGSAAAVTRADLLKTVVGGIWMQGGDVDWTRFHEGRFPRRISLPVYPFNRRRYALPRDTPTLTKDSAMLSTSGRLPLEQWFYLPSWKRSLPLAFKNPEPPTNGACLVLVDEWRFGNAIVERLRTCGRRVITVQAYRSYVEAEDGNYRIDPKVPAHYARLIDRLSERGCAISWVIHCWSLTSGPESLFPSSNSLELGYQSLLYLMQAFARDGQAADRSVLIITNELQNVSGIERIDPSKAALPALCKIISQEFSKTRCTVADLPPPQRGLTLAQQYEPYFDPLLAEIARAGSDPVLAFRGTVRFIQSYEPLEAPSSQKPRGMVRERGFYAITGGLGGIGLALATRLARDYRARLLLITRESFPDRSAWDALLAQPKVSDLAISRIRRIREMETLGAEICIEAADLTDPNALKDLFAVSEQRWGPLHAVFHLAGDLKHRSINCPLTELQGSDLDAQLRPKVRGLRGLTEALRDRALDFGVAFSSNSAILGGIGFGAYAPASAMLDSEVTTLALRSRFPWLTVNWDGWLTAEPAQSVCDPYALKAEEGLDALWRLLELGVSAQIVVSASPLHPRVETWVRQARTARAAMANSQNSESSAVASDGAHPPRVAPRTDLERTLASIWTDVLGDVAIGVEDNFLELGGDSLIGLRIISRIRDRFGVSVPLVSLMGERATIAGLATEVVTRLAELHDAKLVNEQLAIIGSNAA